MSAPEAPNGFREGDWNCNQCGNHNYASRNVCNRCKGPRPPPAGQGREGDWLCPMCSNHNYAKRQACNKCRIQKPGAHNMMMGMPGSMHPHPPVPPAPSMGYGAIPGGAPGNFRPGDWLCAQCKNHNYQSRSACNKCQAQKPPGGSAVAPMYGNPPSRGLQRFPQYPKAGTIRPGDWMCPQCNNHNYASRDKCNRCSRSKALPPNFREGDWICGTCSNHNYASKEACNKCKEQKPLDHDHGHDH